MNKKVGGRGFLFTTSLKQIQM